MNIQPMGTCRFKSKICVWMLACADPEFSGGGVLTIKQGLRVRFFAIPNFTLQFSRQRWFDCLTFSGWGPIIFQEWGWGIVQLLNP